MLLSANVQEKTALPLLVKMGLWPGHMYHGDSCSQLAVVRRIFIKLVRNEGVPLLIN